MKNKREIQKAETRKKIIEAAYKVYSRNGFSVRTDVIAKEAGVSHGSIFSHFPTVDDLVESLINEFGCRLTEELHEKAKEINGIKGFLKVHIHLISQYESFYYQLVVDGEHIPDRGKLAFLGFQSAVSHHLAEALKRQEGELIDIAASMLFNTWVGLIHYYIQNRKLFVKEGSVLLQHEKELTESYIKMILK